MNRRSLFLALLALAVVGAFVWLTRRPTSTTTPPSPEPPASSAAGAIDAAPSDRACSGRALTGKPRRVTKPFVTLDVPAAWEERPAASGVELADRSSGMTLSIEEIPYPPTVGSTLDNLLSYVVDNVRSTTERVLKASLEPVRWEHRGDVAIACYRGLATASDGASSAVFFSVVGRKTANGGFRVVSLSLDRANSSDVDATDTIGRALVGSVVVSDSTVGSAPKSTDSAGAPLIELTEGAARRIGTMLGKDDVLWVSASRDGASGVNHVLGAKTRSELPSEDAIVRTSSRGIPIVVDAKSVPLVKGTTIEWVEAQQGFRFDNPNASPTAPSQH